MAKKRVISGLALSTLLVLTGVLLWRGYKGRTAQKIGYSTDLSELRDRFNRDRDKVRLLLILSPTCPGCLRGASEVQSKLLEQVKVEELRVYTVWAPILELDAESWVPNAMTRLADQRVSHYWDGKGNLVEAYKPILPTWDENTGKYLKAWDVYLLFPREAEWKDKPPTPGYWMHQLWLDTGLRFDVDTLAKETKKLLQASTK